MAAPKNIEPVRRVAKHRRGIDSVDGGSVKLLGFDTDGTLEFHRNPFIDGRETTDHPPRTATAAAGACGQKLTEINFTITA